MKKSVLIAAMLCGVFSANGLAQQSTLAGNWVANWEANGRPWEANLEISEKGNVWRAFGSNPRNKCLGIDAPVEINYISDNEITMILSFSKALQGCNDVTLLLRKSADGNLIGERKSGENKGDISLKRK